MILETIVTTTNARGDPHIAPMGIHTHEDQWIILPFRPSRTLDNILATGYAIINATDDVRIFAGCLTDRADWPLVPADTVPGVRLRDTLSHYELKLTRVEDDATRPKLFCHGILQANHRPFKGFNRAQCAVLEAAILVSRLDRLPWEKITREIAYLEIAISKTAGPREKEAWNWLMEKIHRYQKENHVT